MRINDLIDEIKNYQKVSTHKASLDIFKLLDGGKMVFIQSMNAHDYNHLHSSFEKLSYANPKEYNTSSYEREYKALYDLLLFYLDRIV